MSNSNIIIDGRNIHTESDVHSILAELMDFGPYYGRNLDSLWDRLSTDIERPIKITWHHSDLSKKGSESYLIKLSRFSNGQGSRI